MGPKGSWPPLKEPAVCLYPDPDQSSACPTTHFLKIHFNIILHSTSLHFIPLHYVCRHFTSSHLNFTYLHWILPIYTKTWPIYTKTWPIYPELYPSTYIYIYIYIYFCYMTPCNPIHTDCRFGVTFLPLIHCISLFTLPSRIKRKTLMLVKIHGVILKTGRNQDKV